MNDAQQVLWKLPGGIQPHSCRLCRHLVIFIKKGETETHMDCWQRFTLQQVCEFANSGCNMFHVQLDKLCGSKNYDSDILDEHTRSICESAYHGKLQLFYPLNPRITNGLDQHILELMWSADDSESSLLFEWKMEHRNYPLEEGSMTLFALEGGKAGKRILNRPLQPKAELKTAKRWLRQCLTSHQECAEIVKAYMPKRLIFLGNPHRNTLYLQGTNSNQPVAYAALSYCWGDAGRNRFTTTNETLALRKQGFDISQLPETLRHAVEVTRALDIEYLWVDALCIIQDCLEDKHQEISKMWQIYKNASIVISAAIASHSDQGFLHERDLGSCYLNTWSIPWNDVDNENKPVLDTVFCAQGEMRRVKKEPTDLRAWTLQEIKLANRVLRFGSSQMVWRCARGYKVDGGSNEEESRDEYSSVDEVEMFYEWKNDVEEFTTRSISNAEDRLPAFAAIAADYAKRHNLDSSQYMAGLWLPWMATGLLWHVKELHDKPTCPPLPPGQNEFPTWSWHLALSGISWSYIPYQGDADSFKLDVEHCHVELEDETVRYGRVRKGSLKVVGALLKICMLGTCPMHVMADGSAISVPVEFSWDREIMTDEKDLYCLEVRKVRRFVPEGIVLKQTGTNVFRRVGYFQPDDLKNNAISRPIWLNRQSITIE